MKYLQQAENLGYNECQNREFRLKETKLNFLAS